MIENTQESPYPPSDPFEVSHLQIPLREQRSPPVSCIRFVSAFKFGSVCPTNCPVHKIFLQPPRRSMIENPAWGLFLNRKPEQKPVGL